MSKENKRNVLATTLAGDEMSKQARAFILESEKRTLSMYNRRVMKGETHLLERQKEALVECGRAAQACKRTR